MAVGSTLIAVIQRLSFARTVSEVADVVRRAVRDLTQADGATFVLREGDACHYVDEDAIGPLWKGRRFPLESCISGWTMLNRVPAAIEDIYADPRIPHEAYRPTFVQSLVMVPVRRESPIAAIGTYWARPHKATDDEVTLLQTLADATALALANVHLNEQMAASLLARAEAEAASRVKDEFLAMLAHELRNPLGTVVSAVGILDRVGSQDDRAERARTILRRQTEHLTRLLDDLLDVARVTTGKIVLAVRPVDLGEVVDHCLAALRNTGTLSRHRLVIEPHEVWVDADPARMQQVVSNLIVNAVKYTPEGGTIRVRVDRDGDEAVLTVADSGQGIAADLLPRVFDLFTQGTRGLDRQDGGLGVGLTLVRRLVEQHGGRVDAHSDGPGRGSAFVVRLPRRTPAVAAVGATAMPAASSAARRHVLVVEDNADAREALRSLLEVAGHVVGVAKTAEEAVEEALACEPDVALIDLGLPRLDGYEVARRLRMAGAKTRLIAVTGYGQPADRQRTKDAGFEEHLVKPVDPVALLRLLTAIPPVRERCPSEAPA